MAVVGEAEEDLEEPVEPIPTRARQFLSDEAVENYTSANAAVYGYSSEEIPVMTSALSRKCDEISTSESDSDGYDDDSILKGLLLRKRQRMSRQDDDEDDRVRGENVADGNIILSEVRKTHQILLDLTTRLKKT